MTIKGSIKHLKLFLALNFSHYYTSNNMPIHTWSWKSQYLADSELNYPNEVSTSKVVQATYSHFKASGWPLNMPTSFDIVLMEALPIIMIKGAQIIEFCNGQQVLGKLDKLLIIVSTWMSLPEWLDYQTVLWVHNKISSQIIKHYSVFWAVELKQNRKQVCQRSPTWKLHREIIPHSTLYLTQSCLSD